MRLPPGEELNEWLAVNTVFFYNALNVLYQASALVDWMNGCGGLSLRRPGSGKARTSTAAASGRAANADPPACRRRAPAHASAGAGRDAVHPRPLPCHERWAAIRVPVGGRRQGACRARQRLPRPAVPGTASARAHLALAEAAASPGPTWCPEECRQSKPWCLPACRPPCQVRTPIKLSAPQYINALFDWVRGWVQRLCGG